ncbi:MAG: hypothetical protein LC687_00240 [Actinobacteria bacterium]|nr:hypothetical protein [Actinomycetota bacterium]MCA1806299.1 hypothetical protein [Actinomycetota bacterium]
MKLFYKLLFVVAVFVFAVYHGPDSFKHTVANTIESIGERVSGENPVERAFESLSELVRTAGPEGEE